MAELETLQIQHPDDPTDYIIINALDFDPAKHQRYKLGKQTKPDLVDPPSDSVKSETESESESKPEPVKPAAAKKPAATKKPATAKKPPAKPADKPVEPDGN